MKPGHPSPRRSPRSTTKLAGALLAALFLALLPACAPESVDGYHTAEHEEEAVSLLNRREFSKAIWLLENREGRLPADPKISFLLAQAYLGRVGIEPLAFAARLGQPLPESDARERLFPKCDNGAMALKGKLDPKCTLKRVYIHAPPVDHPDFARARQLLRHAYPDPALCPDWVNTLIGVVDLISFTKRAGDIYLYAKSMKSRPDPSLRVTDLFWLKRHAQEAVVDAKQALRRAEFSGEKISRLLTGMKDAPWFHQAEKGIDFIEKLGLAQLLDFVRARLLGAEDEIKYGEILDELRDMLAEQEAQVLP
jgi:hypothetical protein